MPAARDPWKTATIKPLVKRLTDAGFVMDSRAREGLVDVLAAGSRTTGLLSLQELLQTMLDAVAASDEYAFHIANAAAPIRTACLVARADYHRFVVGVADCKSDNPTPGGCAAWKLVKWNDAEDNKKRLTSWASKFDASKIGINFEQPVIKSKRTDADVAQEREMLREIVASPADDNPRLVYADWLADRDPPRSEFIVLQCQAAASKGKRRTELEKRASELRVAHANKWGFDWCDSVFYRRGFVAVVSIEVDPLVEHGAKLFATTPVEHLVIGPIERRHPAQILAVPGIGNVTTLGLGFFEEDANHILRALLVSSNVFDRLTTLEIGYVIERIDPSILAAIRARGIKVT